LTRDVLMFSEADITVAVVRHARLANRLRLEVPALLGDAALGSRIERAVMERPGVHRVSANPRSGRVLLEFAPDAPVLAELARLARDEAPPRKLRSRDVRGPTHVELADSHARTADEVLAALGSNARTGLGSGEALRRRHVYGANLLEGEEPPSRFALFARQLMNLPTVLLLGSAMISLLLGDVLDAGAIIVVIGLNAAIGYRMEQMSAELLASWRLAEVGIADVIRDGRMQTVNASDLVPGDLLVVRAGNVVPADARIIDAHRLAADEAPLTGESETVAKSVAPVARGVALADRTSMLYRGTAIASGHGRAIVTATADATELANVQRLTTASRGPKGRLQRRLDALTSKLAWTGIAASGLSALTSLAWRRPVLEVLRDTVALGVAAIPEGLPVTATAALVRAMGRMRERGIVVRRLGTAEALGGVTVTCADKTGTLTENQMRLEIVWIAGRAIPAGELRGAPVVGPVAALLAAAILNSDLDYHHTRDGALEIAGSSTERALAAAAQAGGLDPRDLRARFPRDHLIERTDGARYVISEHTGPDGEPLAFVKGAPEQVVALCELGTGGRAILDENQRLAREGLRVLGAAWRNGRGRWRFLGLIGLRDPLRHGAADAVRTAARAGIRTIMLTGDQRPTAEAIARQVGLVGEVIEGRELPEVLRDRERMSRIAVIARVTPIEKVAVVEALRGSGEIVAMAGDGINDAPALKAADVGIAVGARSTDLARQTADVVLEHEDLRSILAAVAEGRIVQDNLRRAIRFQVAGNLGELLLVLGGSAAGRRLLSPLGLLWINLLTDTLPGLALALEPGDPLVLDRPPSPPQAPILDRRDWTRVVRDGALIAGASGVAAIAGGPLAGFASIGSVQFGYAAACVAPGAAHDRRRFALLVGGSAALHLVAVAAAPMRTLVHIRGSVPIALASFGLALGAPLYLAWRRRTRHEITRIGSHHVRKESSP
jgi:P-type Ca2+ transporter type 2C